MCEHCVKVMDKTGNLSVSLSAVYKQIALLNADLRITINSSRVAKRLRQRLARGGNPHGVSEMDKLLNHNKAVINSRVESIRAQKLIAQDLNTRKRQVLGLPV